MLPVIFFILAMILSGIEMIRYRASLDRKSGVQIVLKYLLLCNVGLMGIAAAYAHLFMADQIAEQIGWETGSPFQSEMGMANLSYGVLGVLSLFFHGFFWMATIIGYAVLLYGAAYVHVTQMMLGDFQPLNTGIFLWVGDVAIPTLLLILLFFYLKDHEELFKTKINRKR